MLDKALLLPGAGFPFPEGRYAVAVMVGKGAVFYHTDV